jgi:quercetin dioxygenase-like cupin family protein
MSSPGKCIAVLCSAILASLLLIAEPLARADVAPKVEAQHLLTAPLAGEPGKEVDIEIYTFTPGASVPWHIHPDAHEFDYELEGTLTVEVKGEPPRDLATGESLYLPPNVVHHGENKSATEPAKVYVVRVKPVGKPLTELIDPGDGGYPNARSQD